MCLRQVVMNPVHITISFQSLCQAPNRQPTTTHLVFIGWFFISRDTSDWVEVVWPAHTIISSVPLGSSGRGMCGIIVAWADMGLVGYCWELPLCPAIELVYILLS